MMIVKHAKDAARRLVLERVAGEPGFYGAFYHGSVGWLLDAANLPTNSEPRGQRVEAFLPRVWEVAEDIMAANRDIED
jgi:hypothetical protein